MILVFAHLAKESNVKRKTIHCKYQMIIGPASPPSIAESFNKDTTINKTSSIDYSHNPYTCCSLS